MSSAKLQNSRSQLEERRASGALTWAGPAAMLFARSILAVLAGSLVAALLALQGSATPWRDAAIWFPLYAALIDGGCLALLLVLMRREGAQLTHLIAFDRARLGRDVLLGLILIAPGLLLILGGVALASIVVYGSVAAPMTFDHLPLPAALYALIVFPLLWGFTEQMTYNGYLATRIQVLCGTTVAVAIVSLIWSLQHAVMPVRFDAEYMLFRALGPIPFSIFGVIVYLRIRRIVPLAIAHWLMDGATVFIGSIAPLLH
jgi:membrane protease YdiL (CAAX protease family)